MPLARIFRTLSVGFFIAALAGGAAAAQPSGAKPNFVVILADDLGYGDLSTYGGWIPVPHIDALAKEGRKFTDFHASGNVCSPTRAGLMTGRYQQRAGIPGVVMADLRSPVHNDGLQPNEVTLPALLKQAGYTTAMFGKWHLGYDVKYNPTQRGFDEFIGYVSGNVDYVSHVDQAGRPDWWHNRELHDDPGYTTHLITKNAVRFLEANQDRPFLLYLPFEAVHAPYQAPGDPAQRQAGEAAQGGEDGPAKGPAKGTKKAAKGKGPKADNTTVKLTYNAMAKAMDEGVGEVIATLRRLNLDKNTLVIFTSDNGATPSGSNRPLRGFKGSDWEGGHREPAIFLWPGRIEPGVTDQLAITLDIMPTLLDLAGVQPPSDRKLDGVSLAPLLLRGEPLGPRQLFWNGSAMRDGPWSLVRDQRDQTEPALYHLAGDPGQRTDLSAKEPQRVKQMVAALEAWKQDVSTGATRQPSDK